MVPLRALTVCVHYDDLLRITLVRNARHFVETLVVTSPADRQTPAVVAAVPSARLHVTDAFTRGGKEFNKGLAIEEGFDLLGREGWLLIWDSDILLPPALPLPDLQPGTLYTAPRVILREPADWYPEFDWGERPAKREAIPAPGYFQLFHADDWHLATRPWYAVDSTHAGGGDLHFQRRWQPQEVTRLPVSVLHLGPHDQNWFGRVTPRLDGAANPERETPLRRRMQSLLRHGVAPATIPSVPGTLPAMAAGNAGL